MLMGWWRVKISSGCPRPGRLAAAYSSSMARTPLRDPETDAARSAAHPISPRPKWSSRPRATPQSRAVVGRSEPCPSDAHRSDFLSPQARPTSDGPRRARPGHQEGGPTAAWSLLDTPPPSW
jgi:hypothetical protein